MYVHFITRELTTMIRSFYVKYRFTLSQSAVPSLLAHIQIEVI
jgi:hypothetical protein